MPKFAKVDSVGTVCHQLDMGQEEHIASSQVDVNIAEHTHRRQSEPQHVYRPSAEISPARMAMGSLATLRDYRILRHASGRPCGAGPVGAEPSPTHLRSSDDYAG